MSGHTTGKGRVHVLRRPLNELLPSTDVAFIENDVGELGLIQVDDTPSVVGDQLQQRRETGVQIKIGRPRLNSSHSGESRMPSSA